MDQQLTKRLTSPELGVYKTSVVSALVAQLSFFKLFSQIISIRP